MKKYFTLLLLLVTSAVQAALIPPVSSIEINGQKILSPESVKTLYCFSAGATPNCTFREQGATSGYQVPNGKTLAILATECRFQAAVTTQTLVYVYSDNDVGQAVVTAFVNDVHFHGDSLFFTAQDQYISRLAFGSGLKIPATKYLGLSHTFNSFCTAYGVLQ